MFIIRVPSFNFAPGPQNLRTGPVYKSTAPPERNKLSVEAMRHIFVCDVCFLHHLYIHLQDMRDHPWNECNINACREVLSPWMLKISCPLVRWYCIILCRNGKGLHYFACMDTFVSIDLGRRYLLSNINFVWSWIDRMLDILSCHQDCICGLCTIILSNSKVQRTALVGCIMEFCSTFIIFLWFLVVICFKNRKLLGVEVQGAQSQLSFAPISCLTKPWLCVSPGEELPCKQLVSNDTYDFVVILLRISQLLIKKAGNHHTLKNDTNGISFWLLPCVSFAFLTILCCRVLNPKVNFK
jgi:hypothetical protein